MKFTPSVLIFLISVTLSNCINSQRSNEKEKEQEEITIGKEIGEAVDEGLNEGLSGMKEALSELEKSMQENGGENVEVVDFRELKDLLPERVSGLKRISAEGERSGWAGFRVSTAKAEYEEGDQRIEINIVDTGGMMGLVKIGLAAWANTEVERETENGYERTTVIDGYKAFEKYDSRLKDGQVSVIVGDRFVVNIEGDNISERNLRTAMDKIDLRKLERMK